MGAEGLGAGPTWLALDRVGELERRELPLHRLVGVNLLGRRFDLDRSPARADGVPD